MSRYSDYMTKSTPMVGFTDAELYDQIDVSDENNRTYVFGVDKAYRIDLPLLVAVKKSEGGHSHRVIDAAGTCHYIPKGWIAIHWNLKADNAIPLLDLSDQMEEANDGRPEPIVDELAEGIFKAIDDMDKTAAQVEDEVLTSHEQEELEKGLATGPLDEAEEAKKVEVQTEDSLGDYGGPF